MNERLPSAATTQVLERVGRVLGARDGTGPDDTPWLRRQREEGRLEGRARLLNVVIRKTLASRGISAGDVTLDAVELAGLTDEDVMDALLACRDANDFHARLRRRKR
jgi:hypothetical protein